MGSKISEYFRGNEIIAFLKKWIIDPITKFFQKIGDFFGYIGSMNILVLGKAVVGGTFFTGLEAFERTSSNERTIQSQEFQDWQREKTRTSPGFNRKTNEERVAEFERSRISVNDAIITPGGKVIVPSVDDTIIATKANVSQVGFDSDMAGNLSSLSKAMEESSRGNDIVDKLVELIDTIRNKPFNNIVSQINTSTDINALRFGV
jgi:hypothetical protein